MNLQPRLGEEAPWLTKNRRSLERNSLTISRVWGIHLQQKMIPKNLEKNLEMPRIEASKPDPTGHQ